MALFFGVACGLLYGVFFAGAFSIALPSLVAEHSALFGRLMDKPRARLLVTVLLYAGILGWGLVGAILGGMVGAIVVGPGLDSPLGAAIFGGIVGAIVAIIGKLFR